MLSTISEIYQWAFTGPLPLAIVAAIGYFVGKMRKDAAVNASEAQRRRESKRAITVCKELETVVRHANQDLALFENHLARFKQQIQAFSNDEAGKQAFERLCKESELLMRPTLRLATQLSSAYDEIRQQSANLMSFTEVRTDPLTGVSNRRALDETLLNSLSMLKRYNTTFSIAIIDIDHFKRLNDEQGHLYGDEILSNVAQLMDNNIRETDQVARYGGEEFMVIMPCTPLENAAVFTDRLRARIAKSIPITISAGVAIGQLDDTPATLIARADAALYAAKKAGRNQVHLNDGREISLFEQGENDVANPQLDEFIQVLLDRTTNELNAELGTDSKSKNEKPAESPIEV